jgi:hypothetical protein
MFVAFLRHGGASYSDTSPIVNFNTDTRYPPYGWSELMKRSGSDAKVPAPNAQSEFYNMTAYLAHRDFALDTVRAKDQPRLLGRADQRSYASMPIYVICHALQVLCNFCWRAQPRLQGYKPLSVVPAQE